jgi:hypothetical protein
MSDYFYYQDELGNLNPVEWSMPGLTVAIEQVGVVTGPGIPEAPLDSNLYGRQNANWVIVPGPPVLNRAQPLVIGLSDVVFPNLGSWIQVLPSTPFPMPSRTGNSIVQIMMNIHMLWTANSGSDAICDWSWDGGVHFIRSLHMLVDKQDDSTVNGINTIFWQLVSGTAPTISITARQVVGITGLSIVGVNNPTWPALGSQVAIIDGGPSS